MDVQKFFAVVLTSAIIQRSSSVGTLIQDSYRPAQHNLLVRPHHAVAVVVRQDSGFPVNRPAAVELV